MQDQIEIGLESSASFTVEEQHSAAHIGSGTMRVLASPSMIAFMEITARRMLDEYLPKAFTTVGIRVDVRHLAACSIGSQVEVRVKVIERDRKLLVLQVDAYLGETQLGSGRHERFVINKADFIAKLEQA